jgi:glucokinase
MNEQRMTETPTTRSGSSETTSMTAERQIDSPKGIQQNLSTTADGGYVVGVDIGGTNLRLALANMDGAVLARSSSSTVNSRSAEAVTHMIRQGVQDLLQEVSLPWNALSAVAAGVPGVTDVDAGIVIATSYLMGWRDVPLRRLLETTLGAPVAVDNDVNLAAFGESWAGAAKGATDFVFLAIGTGIGAGIVLNGRPFHGSRWAAGEIGYMLVPGAKDEPVERGKPGALEGIIGGEGIKAQWQSLWRQGGTTLPENLMATEIFDAAMKGDPQAQIILRQSARMLAAAIYNMTLVLNCPLFVLGGRVGIHPALLEATERFLERWSARAPLRLMRSALGEDAQLMGAVRLALDTANLRSALPIGEPSSKK